ncbi:MAG: hypothetical protein ACQEU4_11985 [Bacillota bacterium]
MSWCEGLNIHIGKRGDGSRASFYVEWKHQNRPHASHASRELYEYHLREKEENSQR